MREFEETLLRSQSQHAGHERTNGKGKGEKGTHSRLSSPNSNTTSSNTPVNPFRAKSNPSTLPAASQLTP